MAATNGKDCGNLDSLEFDGNTVLCRVCGDKASGFHYGVHACEGCKGFFRRSIQQKIQYRPCLKNQQCSIMRVNRNRCQYCRLKKCIAVGMSRDAVRFGRVPKREKAKIIEQMQKVNAQSQVSVLNSLLENENDVVQKIIDSHFRLCDFTRSKFAAFFDKAWLQPRFVDCPAHKACPLNPTPSEHDSMSQWDEFSNCFTPAIRNVVHFAKCIPGFSVFSQEDQVTLLKAGTFEVLLVHLAPLFDSRTNTMLFANGTLYKRSSHTATSNAHFLLDSMFDFADHLNELKLKDEEIALFSSLVIIASDRLGLRYADQVARLQSTISQGLQNLMLRNHPDDPSVFSKLLMKIPDLRTLNTLHSEKLLGLTIPANEAPVAPSASDRCPYSNGMKSEGSPIIPHLMPMEAEQKEVVLKTPFGTFHRDEMKPGLMGMAKQHCTNSRQGSPDPIEADLPTQPHMPQLSPINNGLKAASLPRKRPADVMEREPKAMRMWEYDMRTERSDSLSSSSSTESVDSAYRTISNPGTPRMMPESRSPVPERSSSALNVPALKTALSTPPLNTTSPDPVRMMHPKFRAKQSLSGCSTPEAKEVRRPSPATTEACPVVDPRLGLPPHPFLLYNQYAAAAAFHQHLLLQQQQQQHHDLTEQHRMMPFAMNLSQHSPNPLIKAEPL